MHTLLAVAGDWNNWCFVLYLLYASDSKKNGSGSKKKKRITALGFKFPRSMNLNLSVKILFCELLIKNALQNKICQKNLLILFAFVIF